MDVKLRHAISFADEDDEQRMFHRNSLHLQSSQKVAIQQLGQMIGQLKSSADHLMIPSGVHLVQLNHRTVYGFLRGP
jgi:hypothetical protein